MVDHLYLPQLSERSFPAPQSIGTWSVSSESGLMSKIAGTIQLSTQAESRPITSIPDIWARPILFANTLFWEGSPGHADVVQEWRGLLSLIALRQMYGEQGQHLTLRSLRLSQIENCDVLKTALEKLIPAPVEWKGFEAGWEDVILIGFPDPTRPGKTRYIGGFSPTSLVFAGSAYSGVLQQMPELGAFANGAGRLTPPTAEENAYFVKALYFWVSQLIYRVKSLAGKRQTDLVKLLESWERDLSAELSVTTAIRKELDQQWQLVELGESDDPVLIKHPLFSRVAALVSRKYTEESGILTLRPSRPSSREVFVISPKLLDRAKPWGGRIEKAKGLWGKQQTAQDFIEKTFAGDHGSAFGGQPLADAMWIRPELYFFGSTILKASERGALLVPNEATVNEHFVLPLRATLLEFFSPDEIKGKLNAVVEERDGKVTVRIDLPVGPGEGTFRVERTYAQDAVRVIDAPVLDVFPRYLGKDWGRYYVLTSLSGGLEAVPCIEPRAREVVVSDRVVRQVPDASAKVVTIYALSAKSPIGGDGVYPEAISIRTAGGTELGLIAVPRPADRVPAPQRWIVGIDFGTTNTNVWRWKINKTLNTTIGDPEQLNVDLQDYFYPLTKAPIDERVNLLRAAFLAPSKVEMPIGTAILVFPEAEGERGRDKTILKDYFAYFMNGPDVPPNVHCNIKWGEITNQRYFFDSLLFLIFLSSRTPAQTYQVLEMEFRFTYPKLFSEDLEKQFTSLWLEEMNRMRTWAFIGNEAMAIGKQPGRIARDAAVDAFIPYEDLESKKTPTFLMSEGDAAGVFFSSAAIMLEKHQKKLADKVGGAISVDVGGGTTDIAILSKDQIVFDSSIRLAGQYVTRYILARPALWKKLLFDEGIQTALGRFADQGDEARFGACLNFALNQNSLGLQKVIAVQASDPDVVWLKKMLVLQYGSIAYFCGLACATNPNVSKRVLQESVNIFWGGKAAQFLVWMENGAFRDGVGVTSKMFSAILRNAVYLVTKTKSTGKPSEMHLSPDFKSEAAGGVVVSSWAHVERQERIKAASSVSRADDEFVDEDSAPAERTGAAVLAGDDVTLADGTEIKATDFLEEGVLFSQQELQLDTLKLRTLKHCLNTIDKAMGNNDYGSDYDRVIWDEQHAEPIQTGVFRYLADQAMEKPGARLMEPIFVLEIRQFIDLLLAAEKRR